METLDINKYVGLWYEILHYPSWFQTNHDYNTTALYTLQDDGKLGVVNSTRREGRLVQARGTAEVYDESSFVVNLISWLRLNSPNYVVDKIWLDDDGNYKYSLVTDPKKKYMFLLSRIPHPPLHEYELILDYVIKNYNKKKFIATPHYDCVD